VVKYPLLVKVASLPSIIIYPRPDLPKVATPLSFKEKEIAPFWKPYIPVAARIL
jgi:hypothetical protein